MCVCVGEGGGVLIEESDDVVCSSHVTRLLQRLFGVEVMLLPPHSDTRGAVQSTETLLYGWGAVTLTYTHTRVSAPDARE